MVAAVKSFGKIGITFHGFELDFNNAIAICRRKTVPDKIGTPEQKKLHVGVLAMCEQKMCGEENVWA